MDKLAWCGPYRLREYLNRAMDLDLWESWGEFPPEAPGVYLVSRKPWHGSPKKEAGVLCVGASAIGPSNLRKQIGSDLIPALLGFGDSSGSHPGWKIRDYCNEECDVMGPADCLKMGDLFLAWAPTYDTCAGCIAKELARTLEPRWGDAESHPCLCAAMADVILAFDDLTAATSPTIFPATGSPPVQSTACGRQT